MSKVSAEGINSGAFSLSGEISKVKSSISEVKSQVESIEDLATELQSYNGKLVAGSHQEETKYTTVNCRPQYAYTTHTWSTWKISGTEGVTSGKGQVLNELDEIESALGDLSSEVKNLEGSAEAIDSYINSIQADLGENIDPSKLSQAFTESMSGFSLLSYLAYTKEDAADGKFIEKDKILTEYWTDKALQLEKQDNGTYAIYQKDDNGNKTLMGYTTAITAASYIKGLDSIVNGEKLVAAKKTAKAVTKDKTTTNAKAGTGASEKWEPGGTSVKSTPSAEGSSIKSLDDNKTYIPIENPIEVAVDSKQNIIVPKGKTIYVGNDGGAYTANHGNMVFKYVDGKYEATMKNGVTKTFDMNDIAKSEIK